MPRSIQQLWNAYHEVFIPPNASATQVRMMHHAFFAGFLSMYFITLEVSKSSLEDAQIQMDKLQKEIKEYIKSNERG